MAVVRRRASLEAVRTRELRFSPTRLLCCGRSSAWQSEREEDASPPTRLRHWARAGRSSRRTQVFCHVCPSGGLTVKPWVQVASGASWLWRPPSRSRAGIPPWCAAVQVSMLCSTRELRFSPTRYFCRGWSSAWQSERREDASTPPRLRHWARVVERAEGCKSSATFAPWTGGVQ